MHFLRNPLTTTSAIALFLGALLVSDVIMTRWHVPNGALGSLDTILTSEFDGLQQLTLSSTRYLLQAQNLRVDSVALEDLSHALTIAPLAALNDEIPQHIYALSQEADAVATVTQRLYIEIDAFLHLAIATSHTFAKTLEGQPHWLPQYFCQRLRFCIFTRPRDVVRLHLTLQGHLDIISNAVESSVFIAMTLTEACQRLRMRVDATVSTVSLQLDVPIGEDCHLLQMLWDRSDLDGEEFYTSSRNAVALQSFCAHITNVERQVNSDISTMHALQEVLTTLPQVQSTDLINFEPSLPRRLHEIIDSYTQVLWLQGRNNRLRLIGV